MRASIQDARATVHEIRDSARDRHCESILHDLRNPLATILSAAELLVDVDLPPAQIKRLARNISLASHRMQTLLHDTFDASRGESRRMEQCRLREIVLAARESLSLAAELSGVAVAVEINPWIELLADRSRMERAFLNLVGNAIEAMPKGGEVRIAAEMDCGFLLVHVDDTGPGVPPEIRSKLFQPFVTAGKRGGLGLGLVLSRQTVLDHGGDLWLDRAPIGGARFSLRLPNGHAAPSRAIALRAKWASLEPVGAGGINHPVSK